MIVTPKEVLDYWFGEPARSREELMGKIRRWFQGGPAVDEEVVSRFGPTVHAALSGELDDWAGSDAREHLALVLVLDQFTRNAFRGDPRTHEGDPAAQKLALEAFEKGLDAELDYLEGMFLSMPLLHAESIELQHKSSEIAEKLAARATGIYEMAAGAHLEQNAKYTAIIEQFGRFPHRNELLGRESTAEEVEFLKDFAEKAPPKVMNQGS